MASLPSHILIFGATGNIGRFITDSVIQAQPSFVKVSIFTSADGASSKSDLLDGWKSAGASIIVGDITSATDVANAYAGVDTVISCLGRPVLDKQTELIRLAEASKSVQWFFPSEYGTDIEYGPQSATERPHQMKLGVRKYIQDHTKRLKVTYVVVGPYFEMWADDSNWADQIGGFDIKNKVATLIDDGEGRIGFTTMPDTGKAVLGALRHPETSYNKAMKIASFVVTPKQVLAEFERQLDTKFKVTYITTSSLEATEAQLWKAGNPIAAVATLRRIWATGGTLYEKWDNETIGLNEANTDSLETAIKSYLGGKI